MPAAMLSLVGCTRQAKASVKTWVWVGRSVARTTLPESRYE
ncbi:MAG: hypothetical protein ACD_75C01004G0002 [uncultured bacterium]|nr:MAG: hypothetical protein ACD_75C01004G0002 [uncultured bacterium]